jgi:hypothetical protein
MTENSNQLSAIKQTANSILERDVDELLVMIVRRFMPSLKNEALMLFY